jgi:hypothetical protein
MHIYRKVTKVKVYHTVVALQDDPHLPNNSWKTCWPAVPIVTCYFTVYCTGKAKYNNVRMIKDDVVAILVTYSTTVPSAWIHCNILSSIY